MFTTNHFIFLGIALLIIFGYLFIQKKFNFSYKTNLIALFCVCVASELIKIMVNMETTSEGTYLTQASLPFHLCSIQIFFVIYLLFFNKNENTKNALLEFMFPSMCIGAGIALFIPTVGVSFKRAIVYQFFIYHSYIIAFAINLVRTKTIRITWKTLIRNLGILFGLTIFAIYFNSITQDHGSNFMYLARPPMKNLPFLNLNQGWYMYFVKLLVTAITLMFIFHLPFILIENKKRKQNN